MNYMQAGAYAPVRTAAAMHFHEPTSLDEAVALLAADGARCLAGGATLVPLMTAGTVRPARLVSLRRIAGLDAVTVAADGTVSIGAMATHARVAACDLLVGGNAAVREAASQIAHPAIRTMGTMGGVLAFAEPSADYPCAVLAADATVVARGPHGRRTVAADAFFVGAMATALQPGEVVEALALPPARPGEAGAYLKFSRVDGDFATACVAVRLALTDGAVTAVRVAVGGCAPIPYRVPEAEGALVGSPPDAAAVARLGAAYAEAADPPDDFRGSADFRRMILPGLIGRAVARAAAKLAGADR
jgi:carbon-monoxide dehydrogenase medium subunit